MNHVLIDYSTLRGCATEKHWDKFVRQNNGGRLSEKYEKLEFPNADYIFECHQVVIELKIIETEFGSTKKFKAVHEEFCTNFVIYGERGIPTLASFRRILKMMHRPIAATAKKADLQIRETKRHLKLDGWAGLLILVNDNFRISTPHMVEATLARALNGSMSSIDAAVYLTNHFVEMPGLSTANLVWSPMYSPNCRPDLPDFVNWLGQQWHQYCESVLGKFDAHIESDTLTLSGAVPVEGPYHTL